MLALGGLGTIIVFPFEMDTIVTLSGNRLVSTHYGLYSTICGVGIMLGNLLTGGALDLARSAGLAALPCEVVHLLRSLLADRPAAIRARTAWRARAVPSPQLEVRCRGWESSRRR